MTAANVDKIYTKNFVWEIDNVLALRQQNGHYLQSHILNSEGPLGQQIQWALRLYPRGDSLQSKNHVSVFLHLIDGNGSTEVKANFKVAIVNERGTKKAEEETSICFHVPNDMEYNGWGFDRLIKRAQLDNKNYIVDGHQLILDCHIFVQAGRNLLADIKKEKEKTKMFKEALKSKLKEIETLKSKHANELDQSQKRFQTAMAKLEANHLADIEKCRKEEIETQKEFQAEIAKLKLDLATVEKLRKEEKEAKEKLKEKYEKLAENVRNSSKWIDEIELEESIGDNLPTERNDNDIVMAEHNYTGSNTLAAESSEKNSMPNLANKKVMDRNNVAIKREMQATVSAAFVGQSKMQAIEPRNIIRKRIHSNNDPFYMKKHYYRPPLPPQFHNNNDPFYKKTHYYPTTTFNYTPGGGGSKK